MVRAFIFLVTISAVLSAQPAKQQQLKIENVRVAQFEDGPAVPSSFQFFPGDTVFVRFEISGYKIKDPESNAIQIGYAMAPVDPSGKPLDEPSGKQLETELAPQDKNWLPKARHQFVIPDGAPSGDYSVKLTAEDMLAKQSVTGTATFHVKGKDIAPSDTLAVRNFRFLRSENDGPALDPASYRPGDAVWARFEIVGYKYGEKNAVNVDYGLTVLRASGKELFSQPIAADEKSSGFYPKRYVPGILSLTLDKDIRPGEYTILLTVRDHLGNQQSELKQVFKIE